MEEKRIKIGGSITVERTKDLLYTLKTSDGYLSDGKLTYEEVLGVIALYIQPEKKPCLHWLVKDKDHNKNN
nr:MAG TPA: hypothetical protein [Caudoviricetes sp.]